MPLEAKPLFRPDVLRTHLGAFASPLRAEAAAPKLRHWAELFASRRADSFKEQELLPDFLTDFFCGLLGYTRPADGEPRYTLSREKHVEVDGKFADAVLGDFNGDLTDLGAPDRSLGGSWHVARRALFWRRRKARDRHPVHAPRTSRPSSRGVLAPRFGAGRGQSFRRFSPATNWRWLEGP